VLVVSDESVVKLKSSKNLKPSGNPTLVNNTTVFLATKTKMLSFESKIFCGGCKTLLIKAKASGPYRKKLESARRCIGVTYSGNVNWQKAPIKRLPKKA